MPLLWNNFFILCTVDVRNHCIACYLVAAKYYHSWLQGLKLGRIQLHLNSNYRPVSILKALSKIYEKALSIQVLCTVTLDDVVATLSNKNIESKMWKFVCIKRIAWCFGVYTSGQRYGITTTKWHLPEFDRYLLFLVVCSIAERNTVDFIDPLHNQIEWPSTVSNVLGPLRLRRRKKVSSGVVTLSEVCLAITLMLLCSVGFR